MSSAGREATTSARRSDAGRGAAGIRRGGGQHGVVTFEAGKVRIENSRRGTTTTSRPASGLWRRNSSRDTRFARFRITAPPSFRVAATPSRVAAAVGAGHRAQHEHRHEAAVALHARRRRCARSRSGGGRARRLAGSDRTRAGPPIGYPCGLGALRNRQALAALGAAALQHHASVLGRHAYAEAVRLAPAAAYSAGKCASWSPYSLPERRSGPTAEPPIVDGGSRGCQQIQPRTPVVSSSAFHDQAVFLLSCQPAGLCLSSACRPSFPQLWKILWKIQGFPDWRP